MTRETRIGLLVGLGFIIMFGLVLSELTGISTSAPVPEPIVEDAARYTWTPAIEDVAPAAGEPAVRENVQLAEATGGADRSNEIHLPLAAEQPSGEELTRSAPAESADSPARQAMQALPEREAPPARTYKVQPDDSLIKIARKVYGPGHRREYMRIFEANRDKLQDPRTVIVGQELVIPPLASADAASRSPESQTPRRRYREMDLAQLREHFGVAETPRRTGRRVYVVQRGDNLTKIARKMLNDDSRRAVLKIYNANKDKLQNPNRLPIGMKLQIPARG